MEALLTFLQNNGTKILAVMQGTVALLCGMSGLIPDSQMKYWLAASAVMTYWRGMANTNAIATAVSQQHIEAVAAAVASNTRPTIAPAGKLSSPIVQPAQEKPS